MSTAALVWSIVFGSLGLGYAVYGRRQRAPVPFLCGIGLMAFPYFVSSTTLLVVVGCALAAVPYFVRP